MNKEKLYHVLLWFVFLLLALFIGMMFWKTGQNYNTIISLGVLGFAVFFHFALQTLTNATSVLRAIPFLSGALIIYVGLGGVYMIGPGPNYMAIEYTGGNISRIYEPDVFISNTEENEIVNASNPFKYSSIHYFYLGDALKLHTVNKDTVNGLVKLQFTTTKGVNLNYFKLGKFTQEQITEQENDINKRVESLAADIMGKSQWNVSSLPQMKENLIGERNGAFYIVKVINVQITAP